LPYFGWMRTQASLRMQFLSTDLSRSLPCAALREKVALYLNLSWCNYNCCNEYFFGNLSQQLNIDMDFAFLLALQLTPFPIS
jgi:hypothetical protein